MTKPTQSFSKEFFEWTHTITTILVVLKILGLTQLSWWIVLAPSLIPLVLLLLLLLVAVVIKVVVDSD